MYLVSRTETFAKLFFIVSFTGLFMYVALAFYSFHTAYSTVSQVERYQERFDKYRSLEETIERNEKDLKYILVWTIPSTRKYNLLPQEGQRPFIEYKCQELNCYITTNKTILNNDYTNFDAIIFNISTLWKWKNMFLPKQRDERQKYVFYAMEPSDNHPICNIHVDNYFNWTWTYKFYSDIFSPFIEVRDKNGTVVAPRRDVLWMADAPAGKKNDVEEVKTKRKVIAWVMDDCSIRPNAMISISKFRKSLEDLGLVFDIYGCNHLECPREGCSKVIQKDYYFYLAYEGSVSEDYVSTEVLKAYDNNAVPVVVGGADYTKFLPENSYINFQFYTEEKLAALLLYTIKNPAIYRAYFNWKQYYTIQKVETTHGYCELCKMLNNREKFEAHSSYEKFRIWWYVGSLKERCLPKGAEGMRDLVSYNNDGTGRKSKYNGS